MKRRVLLVDDEISILLTLKAVLEISGFDVDTGEENSHEVRIPPHEMRQSSRPNPGCWAMRGAG